ncbi:MAG: hypothetical protein J0I71_07185 [Rhodanobacter sp.]|nr:hypothetical protein [Rhodanobacter sp.]MBN8947518.1 hypothetical protein [Rhodanobacter sp.]
MKPLRSLSLLIFCVAASACHSSQQATTGATAAPGRATASAKSDAEASLDNVHKGMAYADFRTALLVDGWRPVVDLKCKANVVGGAYKELCAKGLDSCKACDELPELGACSGDAVCLMHFQDAATHRQLDVSTYGDLGDRNVHGVDSQLGVTGWTVSSTALH